jgi:hypothetical protein
LGEGFYLSRGKNKGGHQYQFSGIPKIPAEISENIAQDMSNGFVRSSKIY